jgi:hypothetical protein
VFTGAARGEAVLVGPYEGTLMACFFGPDGVLRGVERRPQKAEPTPDLVRDALYLGILQANLRMAQEAAAGLAPLSVHPRALEALAWNNRPVRLAWEWAEQMGVAFGPIRVRRFALPGKRIGIEDGNRLYERDAPEDECGTLEGWLAGGCFVFWWSRDLWVGGDGQVFAS